MKKAVLYIHGKGGSHLKVEQYRKNCPDYDMIGVAYDEYLPWIVQHQIQEAYHKAQQKHDSIYIIANSIGAYFAMLALQDFPIEKGLFISPVVDMEQLILDMMGWAGVSETELQEKEEIPTDFGETLSWKYLCYVREHPIFWNVPTSILYADKDNLVSRKAIDAFMNTHQADLTVMENGEHWFHTEEQLAFLNTWMKQAIR